MALEINTNNFDSYIEQDKPLMIDFWAEWCGPCKRIGPVVEELSTQYANDIVIGKCDVDENDELCARFGVRNIPTLLFIKHGEVVDKHVGAGTKAQIEEKIKKLL
ncbi:MAG: thioredoxin [Bacteroidales bacterium]|nr:thioredoxin [Bacteroidales bacterium]